MSLVHNGYSEHFTDMHKLKEIEKKQQILSKEIEGQDAKAKHFEYMAVKSINNNKNRL